MKNKRKYLKISMLLDMQDEIGKQFQTQTCPQGVSNIKIYGQHKLLLLPPKTGDFCYLLPFG